MSEEASQSIRVPEYGRVFSGRPGVFAYLEAAIDALMPQADGPLRILDIGCGNGYWLGRMLERGHSTVGVDASAKRIEQARSDHPDGRFENLEVDTKLLETLGEEPFDLVVSTEVVEHLFQPADWAATCYAGLRPGGTLICSTPYHGWLKNVAIAASNRWDHHHHTLRQLGHIKFFSVDTLSQLLTRAGFAEIDWRGAGGMPFLWKCMVMSGVRPD